MKATTTEIRAAVEFLERLVLLKTNGGMNLSSPGYEPIWRRPRESFVNYALRVKRNFKPDHKLPRKRLKRNAKLF
jgi:hypothetical protein